MRKLLILVCIVSALAGCTEAVPSSGGLDTSKSEFDGVVLDLNAKMQMNTTDKIVYDVEVKFDKANADGSDNINYYLSSDLKEKIVVGDRVVVKLWADKKGEVFTLGIWKEVDSKTANK